MAINYTTLLGLAQPVTGTESNVWGDVVNDSITALLDSAIAGTATINVTSGSVTLTDVDGAADQARMAILVLTGTPGVTSNVVAPSRSKSYIVINQSDSSAVLKGAATTGVTIRAGQAATCAWNGSDFEIVASGDVDGPSSATDNAVVRYDGTTGKLVQNSGVTIDDSNNVSGVVQLNATTVDTTNIEVTSLKAKDGTAAGSIADATGVVTLASSVLTTTDINGGTIDGTTIGGSTAAAGTFTNLAYTGTLTGGTGVINIGSGQVYKDASGNVGIGIASPSAKLHLFGDATNTSPRIRVQSHDTASASAGILFYGRDASNVNKISEIATFNADLIFKTNNTLVATLDSSGNLGLGVTPSAWSSIYKAIQNGQSAFMSRATGSDCYLMSNAYYGSGGFVYQQTAQAAYYSQDSGTHAWFTAPSGTAGNAISFTQAMTLSAAGQLFVGTTSGNTFDVAHFAGTNATANNLTLFGPATSQVRLQFSKSGGVGRGEVGYDMANDVLRFVTASSERARIDSSGNLLVGTTSAAWGGKVSIESDSNSYFPLSLNNTASGTASLVVLDIYRAGTRTGSIQNTNTVTSYVTSSDYRLKENVQPMQNALATVAALKPCTYTWKADGSEGQGFIAHELQEVCPDAVAGEKDAVDADGKPQYQGVDTSFLVATLTAAIQEQQALITDLQTRLTALEGN